MWTYDQPTGQLFHDGKIIGTGYSGHDDGKNNPASVAVHNVGPIPCGFYTIGEPHDTAKRGPFVLPLEPDAKNEMFGRLGFLIHGDSIKAPGTASEGCIVMARAIREEIWSSNDRRLEVTDFFAQSPPVAPI